MASALQPQSTPQTDFSSPQVPSFQQPARNSTASRLPDPNRRSRPAAAANSDSWRVNNAPRSAGDAGGGSDPPRQQQHAGRNNNSRPRDRDGSTRQPSSTPAPSAVGGDGAPPARAPSSGQLNRPKRPRAARSQRPPSASASAPPETDTAAPATSSGADGSQPPAPRTNKRRAKFNAGLTQPASSADPPALDSDPSAGAHGRDRVPHAHDSDHAHAHNRTPNAHASRPRRPNNAGKRPARPEPDDLTSTLTRALCTPPYPDCPICFNAIVPAQPTWSCSPAFVPPDPDAASAPPGGSEQAQERVQCCWTTFHLKCVRSWAAKSVKDVEDAWRARGESGKKGDWRCPGCQFKRETVPYCYWCFCGSTQDPKPPRLSTPHSCANPCSRARACGHPCALACHPGPCPPCQVTTQRPCHCGKQTVSFRCSRTSPAPAHPSSAADAARADLSCGRACEKGLACGNHVCAEPCHPGACPPCAVTEAARCWCGKVEKRLACGEGEKKACAVVRGDGEKKEEEQEEEQWVGSFDCGNSCDRPFACGVHRCAQPCHPPSRTPPPCPLSPALTTHCPCGKHPLHLSSAPFFPASLRAPRLLRTACTDPVPTCTSLCLKPLAGCAHACAARCHAGPCPPCSIPLVRPCRCGATTRNVPCSTLGGAAAPEILCDRPCGALRACGRHQCTRVCCPLAALAGAGAAKGKGRKRATGAGAGQQDIVDEAGWHECDLVCGKPLACGNHRCEERDHKGPCPSCLRSSFEEMICHCGLTILDPPIPCGTRLRCPHPCARPPPACGHPRSPHACHDDAGTCPPCPFLTTKLCACGKRRVDNVRCAQARERVGCGGACGRLLGCGFHVCERLCHGGECGPCAQVCGKPRKLCAPAHHPCTQPCHAPSTCQETEPCRAIVTVACPCGRIRQPVACGRSAANASANGAGREAGPQLQLRCTNECAVAKRNARLAEALGIVPETKDRGAGGSGGAGGGGSGGGIGERQIVYGEELVAFARVGANGKFVALVEKTLAEFVAADRKVQVLPRMPPDRRKFVRDLAAVYRMDTQMVDQEPNRSVQLIRRLDTRLPSPLLSATLGAGTPTSALGKLADLRASATQRPAPQPRASAGAAASRGWTAVVARPAAHPASATPSRSTTPWALAAAAAASTTAATAAEGAGAGAAARSSRPSPAPPSQDKADKTGLSPAPPPLAGRGGAGVVDGEGEAGKEADANVPESWEDDDD